MTPSSRPPLAVRKLSMTSQAYLPERLRAFIDLQSIVPTQPNHISPTLKELHNDFNIYMSG